MTMKERGVTVNDKDLRRLNRYQLLELLVAQTERADQLEKELEKMCQQINEKEIQLSNLGSIAEASLQVSGVFDVAQKAADIYLENAKIKAEKIEAAAKEQAVQILRAAKYKESELRRQKN